MAWTSAFRSAGRGLAASPARRDISKPCSRQTWRRTAARVSLKVGRDLRYQALFAAAERSEGLSRAASRATTEKGSVDGLLKTAR